MKDLAQQKDNLFWISVVLSILAYFSYWINDDEYGSFLIHFPLILISLVLTWTCLQSYLIKFYFTTFIGLVGLLPVIVTMSQQIPGFDSSKAVFVARLIDDRSAVVIKLRRDSTYNLSYEWLLGSEEFKGKYRVRKNQVILYDRNDKKDFVPDTLTIINDKLILHFDTLGKPDLEFARYFGIEYNRL